MTRWSIAGLIVVGASLVCVPALEAQTRSAAQSRPSIADQIRSERGSIIDRIRSQRGADATPGSVADDIGEISGDERFLRGARDATDFVGADSRDRGFVGGQSAAEDEDTEIHSAIEGDLVREAVDPAINRLRTLPQLQTGMYAPRLRLGFTPTKSPVPAIETAMKERLVASPSIRATEPIEVSMEGQTATLRGTVGSEHEKRLAGLMLLFEPGISKVQNELAVASPDSTPSPEPQPASAPSKTPTAQNRQPDQG